ncbi:MAG TPA: radical SAM protein [Methanocorpusculum sp.]|nr:radical SAM protein [Methanocorpusculum sp.]HJJ57402.1 radical SAM protein [Methanocorpusculum sp.]
MLLETLYVSLPPGANLHYFGDGSILQVGHRRISLNSVLTDILTTCTGQDTIKSICNKIIKEYSNRPPNSSEKEIIHKKIIDFIEDFTNKSLLVLSSEKQGITYTITGIKGKFYPRKLTLELTDCCNLRCTHCFKEANCKNTHFLEMSVIEDICNNLSGGLYEIQLTGGEPTLHPNIEEIIIKLAQHFRVSLLTNGTVLSRVSDETLQLLRAVQISIYGYSEEIFAKITDTSGRLFNDVGQSIRRVRTIRESRVTIVLNSFVVEHLEDYILYAISYSAKEIKFSIPSPMGRVLKSKDMSWVINEDKQLIVKKELSMLHNKYLDKINVIVWDDSECPNTSNIYDLLNVDLPFCGAGGLIIALQQREN